jgi:Family of unknown function (DUF6088)
MSGISDRIMRRARAQTAHGARLVFTAQDFLDFGGRAAVDQALSRLNRTGTLRRIGRGMYDIPRINPLLKKPAAPDIGSVVDAVARRDDITIVPSGLTSANKLGLTNAVPARNDYLTDGSSRTLRIGNRTVRLRHVNPKLVAFKNRPSGDVVRALHWLGRDIASDDKVVNKLRSQLPSDVKQDLARARPLLAGWTARVADRVLADA